MKKWLALILAAVMCLSFAACGGNDGEKTTPTDGNATSEALTTKVDEAAKRDAAVSEVNELIGKITGVDLNNAEAILAAKTAYDELPEEYKTYVEKSKDLEAMAQQVNQLKKEAGERLLNDMRKDEDRVRNMCFYYPSAWKFYSNGSWAADQRSFVLPYLGYQDGRYWVRLVFNYTDDDWVFFEKITVAADSERFFKFFSYNDVVRDNDGGDVWEYVDIEVNDSDIKMLRAIADSEETIIRFEGDDYYNDFTVKDSDKEAIKAVLDAYEFLK